MRCATRPGCQLKRTVCRVSKGLQAALRTGVLEEGHACVQDDAAALVVAAALSPQPGETLLDTCAAPGGKALFAASCMHPMHSASQKQQQQQQQQPTAEARVQAERGGLVFAMDVSPARIGLLQKTAALWGLEDRFIIGACDLRNAATDKCAPCSLHPHACCESTCVVC
jgi:16S rRNA C967 or C1407 C5-methylase (RsmB/RsmF family)